MSDQSVIRCENCRYWTEYTARSMGGCNKMAQVVMPSKVVGEFLSAQPIAYAEDNCGQWRSKTSSAGFDEVYEQEQGITKPEGQIRDGLCPKCDRHEFIQHIGFWKCYVCGHRESDGS